MQMICASENSLPPAGISQKTIQNTSFRIRREIIQEKNKQTIRKHRIFTYATLQPKENLSYIAPIVSVPTLI